MKTMRLNANVGVALLFFSCGVTAADFTGTFYEKGSNRTKVVFTNQGRVLTEGTKRTQRVVFKSTLGEPLVIEETVWEKGVLRSFSVDRKQLSDTASVEIGDDELVFHTTQDGKTKTAREKRPANTLVAGELDVFIAAHWAQLLKGETLTVQFVVAERRETIGFKFFKAREALIDGHECVIITMAPSNIFIGLVVKPLQFAFNANGVGIREIDGRASPKLKKGSGWADSDVEATFTSP